MKPVAGVLIETDKNEVKPAVTRMIEIARHAAVPYMAVVQGDITPAETSWLSEYGCRKIICIPSSDRHLPNPMDLSIHLANIIESYQITHFMGLSSPFGKDVLPRLAALADGPLVMDCMEADLAENTATTSQYSGKTVGKFKLEGSIRFFGIRPIPVDIDPSPVTAQVEDWHGELPENTQLNVIQTDHSATSDEVPLSEATIIIAGGRGMKKKENFSLLFECAKAMNATVGSSRVPVDFGWVPYAMQVGQTGEKVSPRVYIACGISGSVQHFAGMKSSGLIIAVNQDENAFISSNCNYYVNTDVLELIPEITRILTDE